MNDSTISQDAFPSCYCSICPCCAGSAKETCVFLCSFFKCFYCLALRNYIISQTLS